MGNRDRAKRFVGAIYSVAADRLYEPLVVNGAFKVFGGNLNTLAVEQGRKAVEVADGRPILDMPVGTAFFTVQMARRHDGLVVGADIAAGMVDRAKESAEGAGAGNLRMVQADAHHLPFPDGTFGAVMCTNGLQVIPGLRPAISELTRVLSPGGVLFISVLTLAAPRAIRSTRRDNLPTALWSGEDIADVVGSNGVTVRSVRKDRLATLIEAAKS
jgi:SAM-dependent methyltransferase